MSENQFNEEQSASTLGEYIRRARLAAGVDISDLAREIRVPTEMLEYLEQGNYAKLPVDAYVRGYLNTICTRLDLNRSKVLDWYAKESGRGGISDSRIDSLLGDTAKSTSMNVQGTSRNNQLGVGIVVVLLLIAFVVVISNRGSSEEPSADIPATPAASTDSIASDSVPSLAPDSAELSIAPSDTTKPTATIAPQSSETSLEISCIKDSAWVKVRRIGGITWANTIKKSDKARTLTHSDTMAVTISPIAKVTLKINGTTVEAPKTYFKVFAGQIIQ